MSILVHQDSTEAVRGGVLNKRIRKITSIYDYEIIQTKSSRYANKTRK